MINVPTNKKKKINEGIRSIGKNLIRENEIEQNIKDEIQREIHNSHKKK